MHTDCLPWVEQDQCDIDAVKQLQMSHVDGIAWLVYLPDLNLVVQWWDLLDGHALMLFRSAVGGTVVNMAPDTFYIQPELPCVTPSLCSFYPCCTQWLFWILACVNNFYNVRIESLFYSVVRLQWESTRKHSLDHKDRRTVSTSFLGLVETKRLLKSCFNSRVSIQSFHKCNIIKSWSGRS